MIASLLLLALGVAPPASLSSAQAARIEEAEGFIGKAGVSLSEGRHEEACAFLEKALELERGVFGEVRGKRLDWLEGLARTRQASGQFKQAIKAREEVLANTERWHGRGHWATSYPRIDLQDARDAARRTPKQAAALARADELIRVAIRERDAGRRVEAMKALREAARLAREAAGEKHHLFVNAMCDLGLLVYESGEWKAAVRMLRGAHESRVALLGAGHPETLTTTFNLALALQATGETETALAMMHRVLAGRLASLGASAPEYGETLTGIALVLRGTGEHRRCLPLVSRAAELARDIHGERSREHAVALNNLAVVHVELGDPRSALPLYQRSLTVIRAVVGERNEFHAAALFNLAALYDKTGDHAQALPLYEKALRIRRDTLGRKHPLVAETINGLARLRMNLGENKEALELHREALGLVPKGNPLRISTRMHMAECRSRMGDRVGGMEESRRVLATMEGNRRLRSVALVDAARIHHAAGAYDPALRMLREALGLQRLTGERGHYHVTALVEAAAIWAMLGRRDESARLADRALDLTAARLRDFATFQSERQQLDAAAGFRHGLDVRLSLDVPGEYRHVLAARGAILMGQQRRRLFAHLVARSRPEVRELAVELRGATRALASAPGDDTLAARKEGLESRLATLAADFRREQELPTPKAIAAALPEGAVLIDYNFYYRIDFASPGKGPIRLTAFVLKRGMEPERIDLGPAETILQAVEAWRRAAERGEDVSAKGAVLRRLLILPFEKHLARAKELLVCPDGPVAMIPLGALPGRKAGTYLLEEMPVTVVPSPRSLMEKGLPMAGKPSLLTVGGVDFGKRAWAELPGTAREVRAVAAAFRGEAALLSGRGAGKPEVMRAMESAGYCHLATHGFFTPEKATHPLLASGLVLAGDDAANGTLTALEVAELDLSRCRLAVLSACETGLGAAASGEGLLGLQRAFQVAGARAVVASLWMVPDGATALLMERFYDNLWKKKMAPTEALRQAQLFILNEGRRHPEAWRGIRMPGTPSKDKSPRDSRMPPKAWAAWVLSGDGR